MNPGNIVRAPPGILEHLRYGTSAIKHLGAHRPCSTSPSRGGFAAAIEMCNGVGACRKTLEGTMCPSYMATRDEEHSTRGRANALRAVLSGRVPPAEFTGRRLYEVMDLCLECKGCKAECPSNVDMAKMKYEFLHHYYQANGASAAQPAVRAHRGSSAGCRPRTAADSRNWMDATSRSTRAMLERVAGIDRRRPLPTAGSGDVHRLVRAPPPARAAAPRGEVVLFHDTFVTYNTPAIGQRRGEPCSRRPAISVVLADHKCCGRPMISRGCWPRRASTPRWNVERLHPFAARGVPIVGLEPSCLLTLRDEYGGSPAHRRGAGRWRRPAYLLEQFLVRERARGSTLSLQRSRPRARCCTATATRRRSRERRPRWPRSEWAGFTVAEVDSGCCGMAGSFGFETRALRHLGGRSGVAGWFPPSRPSRPRTEIVAPGISAASRSITSRGGGPSTPPRCSGKHSRAEPRFFDAAGSGKGER